MVFGVFQVHGGGVELLEEGDQFCALEIAEGVAGDSETNWRRGTGGETFAGGRKGRGRRGQSGGGEGGGTGAIAAREGVCRWQRSTTVSYARVDDSSGVIQRHPVA